MGGAVMRFALLRVKAAARGTDVLRRPIDAGSSGGPDLWRRANVWRQVVADETVGAVAAAALAAFSAAVNC